MGVREHVVDTQVSSQFWFSVAGFYYVLCDTCVLPATYLPFALMVKWTPPLPFSHSHAYAHFLPFYNCFDSCKAAATGYSLVTDYLQGERLCFLIKSLFTVFLRLTYIQQQGGNQVTQTYVHTDKEALLS